MRYDLLIYELVNRVLLVTGHTSMISKFELELNPLVFDRELMFLGI